MEIKTSIEGISPESAYIRHTITGTLPPRAGQTACAGVEHPLCVECDRRRIGVSHPEAKVWVEPALNVVAGVCPNHVHLSVRAIVR